MLIIQTAFLGDVVLSTSLVESIIKRYPKVQLHFLLKKGNEIILENHPFIKKIWTFNKKNKFTSFIKTVKNLRSEKFDLTINLQRFLTSGLITVLSNSKITVGFKKNPLSTFYSNSFHHLISKTGKKHEIERNHVLIKKWVGNNLEKPKLYPSDNDYEVINQYTTKKYITIAPASVWFTKQLDKNRWIEFINSVDNYKIFLIGSDVDKNLCEDISVQCVGKDVENLCGKITPLQSVALMKKAKMNYVNDSAPLHFSSSINAPVAAIFCSTIPAFGFGPLADKSYIIESNTSLPCKPCGLHGKRKCPLGHFNCSTIDIKELLKLIA